MQLRTPERGANQRLHCDVSQPTPTIVTTCWPLEASVQPDLSAHVRRVAATCLDTAAQSRLVPLDGVASLQIASQRLNSSVCRRLDRGRAHALCTLALTLAKGEFEFLDSVQAGADGSLLGIEGAMVTLTSGQVRNAAVTILAHHLRLVATLTDDQTQALIVRDVLRS